MKPARNLAALFAAPVAALAMLRIPVRAIDREMRRRRKEP